MKKYFLFAAVAGMLTSCSSESLTGSDPNVEPTPHEDLVPIEIGVATAQTKASTRGVGTVGDVAGGAANKWQGEKVNVFMFKKGTLDLATDETNPLYDNATLTTPTAATSGIAYEYYDSDATAGDDRVRYKYYPISGTFDFWGYYADDAATGAPAPSASATEITVPFSIKGTQDLMVAKAKLTDAQNDATDPAYAKWHADGVDQSKYYSAYAARRNIQPNMTFNHLLTRLTFSVLAGNDETRGFTATGPALPADGNIYTGVFIKSIKVESLKDGNMIVAYTGADRALTDLISFTESATPAAADSLWMDLPGKRSGATLPPLYNPAVFEDGTQANAPWTTAYLAANDLLVIDADLSGENAHWNELWRPKDLATAASPVAEQIGGAVLVAPDDSYIIEVELGQYLLESEDMPVGSGNSETYNVVYTKFRKEITPTKINGTTQGVSYNVKMTLYGFERIDISTTLAPWTAGAEIEFGVE